MKTDKENKTYKELSANQLKKAIHKTAMKPKPLNKNHSKYIQARKTF